MRWTPPFFCSFFKKKLFFQLFPPVHIPYNVTQKQKKSNNGTKEEHKSAHKEQKRATRKMSNMW
jgi:hypothetical protein